MKPGGIQNALHSSVEYGPLYYYADMDSSTPVYLSSVHFAELWRISQQYGGTLFGFCYTAVSFQQYT